MASRRQRFDPLKISDQARWLSRLDAHNCVLEVDELAPGTNLRNALDNRLAELRTQGWIVEGVCYSGTFIQRGADRQYVAVYPSDPRNQQISVHGPYPGSPRDSL